MHSVQSCKATKRHGWFKASGAVGKGCLEKRLEPHRTNILFYWRTNLVLEHWHSATRRKKNAQQLSSGFLNGPSASFPSPLEKQHPMLNRTCNQKVSRSVLGLTLGSIRRFLRFYPLHFAIAEGVRRHIRSSASGLKVYGLGCTGKL